MQLTEKIHKTLFEEILAGKYSPGSRMPTEFETAERFNACRVTVRRAYAILEEDGVIVRKKRCGTIVSSNYIGSTSPITSIAAVMPLADNFARVFLETLCKEAAKENILTIIEPDAGSGKTLSDTVSRLASAGVRNMIIWAADNFYDTELFRRLRVLGINLVFFDRIKPEDLFADYVGLDNQHAVTLLVNEALRRGVKHLIYGGAGDLDFYTNKERRKAFTDICRKNGISHEFIEFSREEAPSPQLLENCFQALQAHQGQAALLCVNDAIALKALPGVPENTPVFSIDGTSEALERGIISIAQPMQEMAKQCLAALNNQRARGAKWNAKEYRLQGELQTKC